MNFLGLDQAFCRNVSRMAEHRAKDSLYRTRYSNRNLLQITCMANAMHRPKKVIASISSNGCHNSAKKLSSSLVKDLYSATGKINSCKGCAHLKIYPASLTNCVYKQRLRWFMSAFRALGVSVVHLIQNAFDFERKLSLYW